MRPLSRNLRSEVFKTPKIFFYDTSLMQMLWLKRLQKELLGPVFETSLFAEMVKRHGPEAVMYWRTSGRQEIDFVIRQPEGVLPVEVKLHFPRSTPRHIQALLASRPSWNRSIRLSDWVVWCAGRAAYDLSVAVVPMRYKTPDLP